MEKSFRLIHFQNPQFSPTNEGWTYIEFGHNDSRCTGGAWYYKGDKEAALSELAIRKAKQNKAANAYYNQQWV